MKKLLIVAIALAGAFIVLCAAVKPVAKKSPPTFEAAVQLIKSFEGMHTPKNWPYVGYGHRVLPGDKYKKGVQLSEKEADDLLRKDFKKYCALYRKFGADSLLLAALAYNVGQGNVAKSSVLKRLRAGNRDIEDVYVAHCRYRGKVNSQIKRRRLAELESLFIKDLSILTKK